MKTVGVLGGMGPKATVYFQDLVIDYTKAKTDQENINMIITNHATIPDRTAYLEDNTKDNPIPYLIADAKLLQKCGCDFLVLTCNTSHFAYDEITNNINIPLINMPKEVCDIINNNPNIHKVGLMATKGTIDSKVYEKYLNKELFIGDNNLINKVMDLIYNKVKCGIKVSQEEFENVLNEYLNNGCDIVITGCTELSCILKDNDLFNNKYIIDSMKVLVDKTIELAKK